MKVCCFVCRKAPGTKMVKDCGHKTYPACAACADAMVAARTAEDVTAELRLVKVALRRTHDLPIGHSGGLHLVCPAPCGNHVPMYGIDGKRIDMDADYGATCKACGRRFDVDGYLLAKGGA